MRSYVNIVFSKKSEAWPEFDHLPTSPVMRWAMRIYNIDCLSTKQLDVQFEGDLCLHVFFTLFSVSHAKDYFDIKCCHL